MSHDLNEESLIEALVAINKRIKPPTCIVLYPSWIGHFISIGIPEEELLRRIENVIKERHSNDN